MKKSSSGIRDKGVGGTRRYLTAGQIGISASDSDRVPIDLSTTQDSRSAGLSCLAFNELALRDGLTQIRRAQFPVANGLPSDLSPLGEVLLEERAALANGVVLRAEDGLLIGLGWGRGSAELSVAGR